MEIDMIHQTASISPQGCHNVCAKLVDHSAGENREEVGMVHLVTGVDFFVYISVVRVSVICEQEGDCVLLLAHLSHKVGQIVVDALDSGPICVVGNVENCEAEEIVWSSLQFLDDVSEEVGVEVDSVVAELFH